MGSGTIRTSLFAATDEARIPDGVVGQLAEIFSSDIDFHRELRRGDRFTVVYEALNADGEPTAHAAASSRPSSSTTASCTRRMWFEEPGRKGGYFALDGQSKRRVVPRQPAGVLARDLRLRDAHASDPAAAGAATSASTTRAATGTPVRTRRRRRRRVRRLAERLRQRRASSSTATADQTLYAHLSRIDVQGGPERRAGPARRRRRRHRLGHRPAPALRVPRERRAPGSAARWPSTAKRCRSSAQAQPEFERLARSHARPAGGRLHRSTGQRRLSPRQRRAARTIAA